MTPPILSSAASSPAGSPDDLRSSAGQLWRLLKPYRRKVLGLSTLIAGSAALGTVSPQFIRYAFDTVIPSGEPRLFLLLAAAFGGFYLFRTLVGYAGMYLSYAFTQGIISDIRMRAYSRLLRLPVARFLDERSGSMVARVVSDVNALEDMVQAGATRLAGQLFSILVILAIVLAMNWQLALVNVVVAPLMAWITHHYQEPLRQASRKARRRIGELTAVASEAISNIQVVKGFASESHETERLGHENDAYVNINLDRRKDVGRMEGLITLTAEYGLGVVLLAGGWMVVQGGLSIGELTAFVLYQRMLQQPVTSVMFFNNQLQSGMAALERVGDLLDSDAEPSGNVQVLTTGALVFDDVTFAYPSSTKPVLRNLSFDVAPGQTVAFVGPSGAGKSTVTKLLTRFFDLQHGTIALGGQDIRQYDTQALRRAIALVPQEPTLFSGSIRDNIRYANPSASDAEVVEAAQTANAHAFILGLTEGYDTEIGERGTKLSGGQKQRIAIARALLKDARVLILDEATASLDSESEAVIQDALEGTFAQHSDLITLVIAHRLSTIQRADRIFVLDHGQLVESGTHDALVMHGGLYAHLHDLQYGAGEEIQ
ncbi:MAG: ABC transporter ATP-binding protein [Bacteroidota bacterium]